MRRLLALALHPALYATLVHVQLWRTRRLFPDMSDDGLGAGLLVAAALLSQLGFVVSTIPFARRIHDAEVARVALFATVTAIVGVPLCVLAFDAGSHLEARWHPRIGHVLFLTAPLWGTSVATLLCAWSLLPRSRVTGFESISS